MRVLTAQEPVLDAFVPVVVPVADLAGLVTVAAVLSTAAAEQAEKQVLQAEAGVPLVAQAVQFAVAVFGLVVVFAHPAPAERVYR